MSPSKLPACLARLQSFFIISLTKVREPFCRIFFIFFILLPLSKEAFPAENTTSVTELVELSLEELVNIQITTVSRRLENLSSAPASIYVITDDEIRRSGVTTIPEVLRLAPNLQVARLDNAQYAISARGFNNTIGNKLLILIDGRTIYTPLFSGVFWEMQDILIEDIERVEVISGPGATLWGANAVNGVINIISRSSADTLGTLVTGSGGTNEKGMTLRSGGRIDERATIRAYAKFREFDRNELATGAAGLDQWEKAQAGFRMDWTGERQNITFQGDIYQGESQHRGFTGGIEIPPIEVSGGNLLTRWNRELADGSSIRIQGYWSRNERKEFIIFSPKEDIFDIEFQHDIDWQLHNIVWGGGYRHARDKVGPGFFSNFIPDSRELDWQNIFIQDEIEIWDNIRATAGIKLEWNDYTGMEYMPSLRLSWSPGDNQMLWSALSRAVRAPSRFDREVFFPATPPYIVAGGPGFEAEVAKVIEFGYRGELSDKLSITATLYHHDWEKLRSGTALPLPTYLDNNIEGEVYGIESWGAWQITDFWLLRAGVSTIDKSLSFKSGTSADTVGVNNPTLHNDPDYQWMLRSSFDLPANLYLDLNLRGIDELTVEPVPDYRELDIRLSWIMRDNIEVYLTGRNLLNESHPEYGQAVQRSEIPRNVLLGFQWTL